IRSKSTGQPIIPYYVPVTCSTGQTCGILGAAISLDSLTESLLSLHLASRVAVNDNSSGQALVSDDPSRILARTSTGQNAASTRARAGERGAMENMRSDGEATLAAFSQVPNLPWSVLLQESSSHAFGPIDDMTRQALVWVGIAVLLAGLVAG